MIAKHLISALQTAHDVHAVAVQQRCIPFALAAYHARNVVVVLVCFVERLRSTALAAIDARRELHVVARLANPIALSDFRRHWLRCAGNWPLCIALAASFVPRELEIATGDAIPVARLSRAEITHLCSLNLFFELFSLTPKSAATALRPPGGIGGAVTAEPEAASSDGNGTSVLQDACTIGNSGPPVGRMYCDLPYGSCASARQLPQYQ